MTDHPSRQEIQAMVKRLRVWLADNYLGPVPKKVPDSEPIHSLMQQAADMLESLSSLTAGAGEGDYARGFEECRRQCLAYAEERTVSKSVIGGALAALDEATGSDTVMEREWFGRGRVSAASRIADDIRAMRAPSASPPIPSPKSNEAGVTEEEVRDEVAWLVEIPASAAFPPTYVSAVGPSARRGDWKFTADANAALRFSRECDAQSVANAIHMGAVAREHMWPTMREALQRAQDRAGDGWQPIETAPKDGTLLLLLIGPDDDREHPLEDTAEGARTIGFNNLDNDGEDVWKFAGWCWSHDHFNEGEGTPTRWRPLPEPPRSSLPSPEGE